MDSHLSSIRAYPSSFPSCPSPSPTPSLRNNSHAFDHQAPLPQLPASPFHDDKTRKPRAMQETTWIAPPASQTARFPPAPLLSQSLSSLALAPLSELSAAALSWNDNKRRKFSHHDSHQVSTSSDTLTSSALSLACLSLSGYPEHSPINIDSKPFNSFSPTSTLSRLPSSPPTSPASSPTISRSGTLLSSSSSEVSSSSTSSPSSTPPSSPTVKQRVVEIRHKGKQLKSRCTCCHVCRTSLKNYPRNHLDCTACNAVVCQPCIEFRYP